MALPEGIVKASLLTSVAAFLAVTAAILSAQSLAEIAAQEKKRREKMPPSKVIRDDDLKSSGASVSEMGTESTDSPTLDPPLDAESVQEEMQSDWPQVFAECRSRYDAVKSVRDQKQDLIVTGLPIGTDLERIPCARIMINEFTPGWIRYAIDCERIAEEVVAHEEEMRQIQDQCHNEARIRGIPPGEARLD